MLFLILQCFCVHTFMYEFNIFTLSMLVSANHSWDSVQLGRSVKVPFHFVLCISYLFVAVTSAICQSESFSEMVIQPCIFT
jgi:hypothetical protein